eukprot:TRINITY_DN3966_c0_g1_i1.p1 TRINITY_DN3966_c0_g1~~TRINITY_DN3966_c0_g1_i1.p1  ORF type:complete len:537 (+),score=55.98 TRINITY_DN3966_c0_g1_i1:110-1720(+)
MAATPTESLKEASLKEASLKGAGANILATLSLNPHSSSKRRCTFGLEDDALRAVDIRETLSGFGQHWKSSAGGADEYGLSMPVANMNYFLSHCWSTPRLRKTLALLYYNNMTAAWLISLLTTFLMEIVRLRRPLGEEFKTHGMLCGVISLPVLLFVFFTWHHLQPLFGRRVRVFLDKICIHQTDPERKTQGILALGAFMKASDCVVVLWAPEYFSRLWCTYELAAWERLDKDFERTVHFVPVFATCATFACCLFSIVQVVDGQMSEGWESPYNEIWQTSVGGFLVQFVITHLTRAVFHEFQDLGHHAANYDFFESKCFCCTVDHRMPTTGAPLLCDRKMVLRTIRSWYSGGRNSVLDEDIVEIYHKRVRQHLSACAKALVATFCSYASIMSFDIPLLHYYYSTWLWKILPLFAYPELTAAEKEQAAREQMFWLTSMLCTRPLARRLLFSLACRLPMPWADKWRPLDLAVTAAIAATYSVLVYGVFFGQENIYANSRPAVVVIWSLIQIVLVLCIFALPGSLQFLRGFFKKGDPESE